MKDRDISRRHMLELAGAAALASAAPVSASEQAEYPLYKARGTHRELGRQHGEQASRQIRAHIEMMRARPKRSDQQFKRSVAKFQPMFEGYCPHLLDEMRGLAEGAGVTLEEAMACSIRGELAGAPTEGCTAYAIGPGGTTGHAPLAGQNADMGSQMIPLAYILHLQPQNKPEVLIWTFGGMLGYHGMNSAGVAHFSNALSGGPRNQFGMPEYVYERLMLECSTTEQVIDVLRNATATRSLFELEMNKGRLKQVGNRHDGDHPFNQMKKKNIQTKHIHKILGGRSRLRLRTWHRLRAGIHHDHNHGGGINYGEHERDGRNRHHHHFLA